MRLFRAYMAAQREQLRLWLEAWRGRKSNPLARRMLLQAQRPLARRPWYAPLGFMTYPLLVLALIAAAQLGTAYWQFHSISDSAVASRAFAVNTLLWGIVVLSDSAVMACIVWLLGRLWTACAFCSGLLGRYRTRRVDIDDSLTATQLSDQEFVVGALVHVLRLTGWPLVAMSLIAAANQSLGAYALNVGQLTAPDTLAWLALFTVCLAALKLAGGTLAVLATALVMLGMSPFWRIPAAATLATALAWLWHLASIVATSPARSPFSYRETPDLLGPVFAAPAAWALLGAGTLLLVLDAHAAQAPRALDWLIRRGLVSLRTITAGGLLAVLYYSLHMYVDYDVLYARYSAAHSAQPVVQALLPGMLWPLQAASAFAPLPLFDLACPQGADPTGERMYCMLPVFNTLAERGPGVWQLVGAFVSRALLLLGLPLFLCLIYLAHARAAVYVRRRGAP